MTVFGELQTRVSKAGKSYKVVVLEIAEGVEKLVFLSPAEIALIEKNN